MFTEIKIQKLTKIFLIPFILPKEPTKNAFFYTIIF